MICETARMSRCRCWVLRAMVSSYPWHCFSPKKEKTFLALLLLWGFYWTRPASMAVWKSTREKEWRRWRNGKGAIRSPRVSLSISLRVPLSFFCFLSFILFSLPTPFRSKEKFLSSLNPQNISKIVFSYGLTISKEVETIRQIFEKNVEVIFFNNN